MKHSVSRSLGAGILLAVALLGGSWVQAAPAHDGDQSTSVKKAKKAKGGSAGQVRFLEIRLMKNALRMRFRRLQIA